jgi:peptidyl-prolyl cis-trans isomerase SurA
MQIVKKSILIITILTLSFSISHAQNKKLVDQVAAVVGDKIIMQSDVENQVLQFKAQGNTQSNLKCQVLNELISQKILLIQAEKDSLEVSPNQVESALDRRIQYFIRQIGSKEELEKYYNKTITEIKEDFRGLIYEQIRTQKMRNQLVQKSSVTPKEVEQFYNNLPEDSIPMVNKRIELNQIVKYPPENNRAESQARKKLLDLRKRILEGQRFSTLAVLYSEDEGTASKGGELGFRTEDELDPEFAEAAFSLQEGEVSGIVESAYGYHIIKLIEREDEQVNVRHILIKPKVSPEQKQTTINRLDSIADAIRKGETTFRKAAIEHSDDQKYKRNGGLLINPRTSSSEFELDQLPPADYNAIKDMEVGEISDPYQSQDENGKSIFKIIKIRSKIEPHRANLKQDYNMIKKMALTKKREEYYNNWISKKKKETYIHIEERFDNCNIKTN